MPRPPVPQTTFTNPRGYQNILRSAIVFSTSPFGLSLRNFFEVVRTFIRKIEAAIEAHQERHPLRKNDAPAVGIQRRLTRMCTIAVTQALFHGAWNPHWNPARLYPIATVLRYKLLSGWRMEAGRGESWPETLCNMSSNVRFSASFIDVPSSSSASPEKDLLLVRRLLSGTKCRNPCQPCKWCLAAFQQWDELKWTPGLERPHPKLYIVTML